jgi:accessory gene regulator protein AgrB
MSISYNALYQNDIANYMITVMASIPQPSLAAGVKFVTSSFVLNVVSDCNFTTLINRIIPDISVVVFRPASTESVFVYDTKA